MISKALKKLVQIFWLLPGFLLWASFPPMGEKTDCLFALAPLLWLARNRDAKTNFRRWFLNGFVFWFATLSWMPAIVKNGGPWPLVVLGWGALAAYCALYFGAFGWLSSKVWAWVKDEGCAWRDPPRWPYGRRLFAILVAEPVLWCGLELVRSRLLGGFAWNHLGLPLVNANLGAPATLGGVYLVSAVVILVNGTIAGIAERVMRRTTRWASLETLIPFLLVWGLYAVGGRAVPDFVPERGQSVALVQRNFPCVFKEREENPYEVYSGLLDHVAALKPDLVVLPESALCEFGPVDQQGAMRFAAFVRERTGAALLAGGTRFAEDRTYNSAALYPTAPQLRNSATPQPLDFSSIEVYDKVHLVPFGEFIPGDKWITALQKLAPVGSCTPGELKLLDGCGVAICFEDTDSAQMRRLAAMGAKALVFITNDSWFSESDEAVQHSWQSVTRAIETGLPVVRVGNNGVSGTITPDGRASWLADAGGRPVVDARGTMFERLAAVQKPGTVYVRLGDVPLAVAFALLIAMMVLVKYKDTYEKRRYLSM